MREGRTGARETLSPNDSVLPYPQTPLPVGHCTQKTKSKGLGS